MRLLVNGSGGKMGSVLRACIAERRGAMLVGGVDPRGRGQGQYLWYRSLDEVPARDTPDVLIDVSHYTALPGVLAYARRVRCALVAATTGGGAEERELLCRASSEIPVFSAANLSLGAALLRAFTKRLAEVFPEGDIEIVEAHHRGKRDAPGGTALSLFAAVKEARPRAKPHAGRRGEGVREAGEVGIHALRLGALPGTHTVFLATPEEGLTLTHTAYTPRVFALGALRAAEFLMGAPPGLYGMSDLLYE